MVDVPKEMIANVLRLVEEIKSSGKIRKGTNEATKSVEKGEPKLVVLAEDVSPKEIIMHIPILCAEKKIPCVSVPTKTELGAAAGLPVGTSCIAVVDAGEAAKKLATLVEQLAVLSKSDKVAEAKEQEAKPADAKETAAVKPSEAAEKPKKPKAEKKPKKTTEASDK